MQTSFVSSIEDYAEYILKPGGKFISGYRGGGIVSAPDLWVAKFPVTNKRYKIFLDYLSKAEDRFTQIYLTILPLKKFLDELEKISETNEWGSKFKQYLSEGKHDLPALFAGTKDLPYYMRFNRDNQPIGNICSFDARAYCLWLSLLCGKNYDFFRLPTDFERAWVAGGNHTDEPTKLRLYPWSTEKGGLSKLLANYGWHVGATMPVDYYDEGATPEGIYNMFGNTFEMCTMTGYDPKYFLDPNAEENGALRGLCGKDNVIEFAGMSWMHGDENPLSLCRTLIKDSYFKGARFAHGFRVYAEKPLITKTRD